MNAINSSVSFGHSAAATRKTAAKQAAPKQEKPKFSELGGRTMAEKYGDTNLNTKTAPIILLDYVVDHAIEIAATATTLVAAFAKGKQIMSGTTSTLQKALSNGEGFSSVSKAAQKFGDNLQAVFKKSTGLGKQDLGESLDMIAELSHKEMDETSKVMGKISEHLAEKLESNPDSRIAKFVTKLIDGVEPTKIQIAENGEEVKVATTMAETIQKALAEKHGLSNGGDFVDNVIALAGAGGAAGGVNLLTDKATDLNDANVALKAKMAEAEAELEEADGAA